MTTSNAYLALPVVAGGISLLPLRAAEQTFAPSPGWALDAAPSVPTPAAASSKAPAAPKDFQEVSRLAVRHAPNP